MVIDKIESFVKEKLLTDTTGHDWYHIDRVRKLAIFIAEKERVNVEMVHIAALLHDILDEKLFSNLSELKIELVEFLRSLSIESTDINKIIYIIENVGFKGGNGSEMKYIEGRIIQDADRLDALGAIGIARTFMYSGAKGQSMYDPTIPVRNEMSYEQYRNEKSTAVNHFYEKLLKLKETLHTESAKEIAQKRHQFLEEFLTQFHGEWEARL